eukprot:CAMPEP_0182927476 /NCGR_PEP_ID=MMETSP0105_2-20130417/13803_1 /TAXON_ID=81532 ORGANISM="Acanthoeca-like sp., Strain 10tr" /NCGR_SAMPLE_ID=MMETSP0105_2 /ASSEMBLY_ACC=CAM_ASM_000205 /LENGTH=474 /DNA_ID=CAMNT_0025065425 /DNA_START=131 /DNA_END=1556 /DNA_ORIENTATION=+
MANDSPNAAQVAAGAAGVATVVVIQPDDWQPPSMTYSVPPSGFHDWNYDEKDWQKDPFKRLSRLGIEVITEAMAKLESTPLSELIGVGGRREQFVTGHPDQFHLGARDNLRIGYNRYSVLDSRPVWAPSEDLHDRFSDGLGVTSVAQTSGPGLAGSATEAMWLEVDPQEVAEEWSGGVPYLRRLLQVDGKLTRCLADPVANKKLVLIKGNHHSLLMSRKIERLISEWSPDSVVVETCSEGANDASAVLEGSSSVLASRVKMSKYLAAGMSGLSLLFPAVAPLSLPWTWFMCQMLSPTDVVFALKGAELSGSRVILADWHRAERMPMQNLAKALDEAGRAFSTLGMGRNYNRSKSGWRIDAGALSQIFVGDALSPSIPREAFLEFFEHRKLNEPHDFFMYEKRNDLLASAILNSHVCGQDASERTRKHFGLPGAEKIVAVVGAAHIEGVVGRLTGQVPILPAFDVSAGGHFRVNL